MIGFSADTVQGILAVKASGKLTEGDLDDLAPALQKHVAASEDPRLVMILKDFKGWEDTAAFWKDLQLDVKYIGQYDRIAVIGDKKWQKWSTCLLDPITKGELTFFPIDEAEKAWKCAEQKHKNV